ncbi:MAG: DUF4234 domain-containing protein [Lachnospiraceae bacterium]|nr:DUF4234 domain-containing protein [Lachnospiraceae bacterium]
MVEKRDIVKCIILSIVTCGIYGLFWFIKLTDDTNTVAGIPDGTSGVTALVLTLVTCGIYGWFWAWKQGEKMDQITGTSNNGIIYILLQVFGLGIIAYAIMQDNLNKNA